MDEADRFTIGEVARRTGLSVRTIRFYSDAGRVPPSGRSPAGYRLYDAEGLARLETARALRDLGLDLETVTRVLDRELTLGDVVTLHANTLDTQILRRPNRSRRGSSWPSLCRSRGSAGAYGRCRRRTLRPAPPASPSRRRPREGFELVVAERAGTAVSAGVDPRSPEAAAPLTAIVDALRGESPDTPELRASTAERFAMGNDARVERYRQLLGTVSGRPAFPCMTPAFTWTIEALRAHPHR